MPHSILPPSGASTWGASGGCTGYVMMNAAYPEVEESEAAREGTAGHHVGEVMTESYRTGGVSFPEPADIVGSFAPNGEQITQDMYDGAKMYADENVALMRRTGVFSEKLGIETSVNIPQVHELCHGTPDFWLYDESHKVRVIHITDFKFGRDPVEVFENLQLILYGVGVANHLGLALDVDNLRFEFCIVQPRAFHRDGPVRRWGMSARKALGFLYPLKAAAEEAMGPNAVYRTGSHCVHCPARFACPAATKLTGRILEVFAQGLPLTMDPNNFGTFYAMVERGYEHLKAMREAFEEQAKARIRSGELIPNLTTRPAYGRKKWLRPVNEVLQLGEMMEIDLKKPDEPITPKQAIAKGLSEDVVNTYAGSVQNGFKLEWDNGNKAKQVFSND